MSYSSDDVLLERLLTTTGECGWVEFKTDNDNPELIGRGISALANGARLSGEPEGFLVYGVESDSHQVVGTKFNPKKVKKGNEPLLHWLVNRLNPRWDIRVTETIVDGYPIVILRFDAATIQPISFDRVQWVRVGSMTRRLDEFPDLARKLYEIDNHNLFESGVVSEGLTSEQIVQGLDWRSFFRLSTRSTPSATDAILDALIEGRLINSGEYGLFNITNLGAILLATNLKDFERLARKAVRVVVYKGLDRRSKNRQQVGQRGYAAGFEGLIDYVMNGVGTTEEVRGALREVDSPYPKIAVRELVANALIHQDFTITGAGPMVEIFDDRMEITNPGKSLIAMDRIIDYMPRSRNELLAQTMRVFRICEEFGTGIEKVISAVENLFLPPPIFEQGEDFVRVTLLGKRTLRQMTRDDKVRACFQHCVLRHKKKDPMSNGSFRERLGIAKANYSVVSRIISDAIDDGRIKVQNPKGKSKKFTRYVPIWA